MCYVPDKHIFTVHIIYLPVGKDQQTHRQKIKPTGLADVPSRCSAWQASEIVVVQADEWADDDERIDG